MSYKNIGHPSLKASCYLMQLVHTHTNYVGHSQLVLNCATKGLTYLDWFLVLILLCGCTGNIHQQHNACMSNHCCKVIPTIFTFRSNTSSPSIVVFNPQKFKSDRYLPVLICSALIWVSLYILYTIRNKIIQYW